MAILKSENLELDMSLRWDNIEGIVYDLVFKWRGIPIVNDSIIKRGNDWWSQAKPSGFFFTEYAKLRPVAFFKKMLDSQKSDYIEPIDPDIRITVHPIHALPEDRSSVMWEAEHIKRQREERERLKRELGKLPDDLFEIIFFLDTYNFKGCAAYSGDGISFNFLVIRTEFENFIRQLDQERQSMVEKYSTNPEGNGLADCDDE
ncbi:MAG: hypothetical protein HUU08_01200 [Candidatus Brocadia sp.]|nr:hypothetical protein [Candidatus Brocadia sp.]